MLLGLALYALISRTDVLPQMVDGGPRPSSRERFGAYEADNLWPVRQVQRIPQRVLVVLVALMGLWAVGWVVVFIVGLTKLAV